VIPTIISQIASGRKQIALGDLRTTRDFTFVEDTCRGFLAIAGLDGGAGEVFHIGSNLEISIGDLFGKIAELMQSDASILADDERLRPPRSEVMRLRCDNRKLKQLASFEPETGLEEGLRRTIAWFRDDRNLRRYKGDIYNV
jgi:nucleoside-diphosphate-sugar epimerase